MKTKPETIDAYLATVPEDQRAALEKLRQHIRVLAPEAEECISYELPAFRLDGRTLVAFGAAAHHCALYPMSAAWIKAHHDELAGFSTSKGTIRFQPDKPLPVPLVRNLIKARIAQNAAKTAAAAGPAASRPGALP